MTRQLTPETRPVVYEHDGIHLGDTIEYTSNGRRVTGVVSDINPASAAPWSIGAHAALDPVFPEMRPVVVSTDHRVTPPLYVAADRAGNPYEVGR